MSGTVPSGKGPAGGTHAERASYYGRPVVKAPPWEHDIPAYMFAGGLAAGSSLLAAGADLTGRPALRRVGRLTSLGALGFSMAALVHDLGRPARFLNMLRTVKLTSPMSVGTWILSGYGLPAGIAAAAEASAALGLRRGPFRLLAALGRPAGIAAAVTAPPVAGYTAVLLSDTAAPTWHESYRELPFVFCGSAAAAAGGLATALVPMSQAGPARRLALGGAVAELVAEHRMEHRLGMLAEPLRTGTGGKLMRAARALTAAGAALSLVAGRSRVAAVASGAALVAGSVCTRFGVFQAGMDSAKDPKYTVGPQRERLERGEPVRYRG
ncbi:NrfD/PsrC family molybdoenzyme membrane anchor subunit [Georgenia alba]|uniref:NrfD/PsrC family molybdoenzyme membrane anchor subunit n=1 Tax=Georgenia alba TaxID=2233858 RepID=A0ABW2QAT4_9MICO